MTLKNIRLFPSDIFNNDFQGQQLKHTVVKGSLALIISQGFSFGLSMISTLVLARLLTPSDFGVVGMVSVFIHFLVMFKDAGLSTATIQRNNIDNQQVSSLFWINVIISLILGGAILLSAPLVAMFYKKPELAAVTAVLSVSFMIQGFTIQHSALLQRHLKFTALAINDIVAQLVSLVVAIVMASLGFNYWALVGGTIARTLTLVVLTFYSCPWIPGKMQKGTGVRGMLKFGGHLTGSNVVNYFSRNLDGLLIGKLIGSEPLGLYTKAFSLLMTPLTQVRAPLTTLSLPVLSSLKNDQTRYQNYFQKLLDISISLSLPISVYCFLESEFLITVLLGQKWMGAEPVFKILSVAGVFVATSGAPGLVMLSHGFSKRYLKLTVITSIIICVAFIAGVPFGITGLASGYAIASFLIMVPLFYFGIQGTPIKFSLIITSISGPVSAAAIAGLATFTYISIVSNGSILHHICTGLIFFLLYISLTMLRSKTRETVFSIVKTISSQRKTDRDFQNQ